MRREFLLLREMIDAAEEVRTFIGDFDVEEIRTDGLRRAAVLWGYTVLGEASSQLPADVKEQYPNIEWTEPTRLRNRIVHGYWDVDLQILHSTARDILPGFIAQLTAVLTELEQSADSPQEVQEDP